MSDASDSENRPHSPDQGQTDSGSSSHMTNSSTALAIQPLDAIYSEGTTLAAARRSLKRARKPAAGASKKVKRSKTAKVETPSHAVKAKGVQDSSAITLAEQGITSNSLLSSIASRYPYMTARKETDTHALELLDSFFIPPHVSFDFSFLDQIGLSKNIREFITGIGWECFLLECTDLPVYRELCLEFYSALRVDEMLYKRKNMTVAAAIKFYLFGKEHAYSFLEFNELLGFSSLRDCHCNPQGMGHAPTLFKLDRHH